MVSWLYALECNTYKVLYPLSLFIWKFAIVVLLLNHKIIAHTQILFAHALVCWYCFVWYLCSKGSPVPTQPWGSTQRYKTCKHFGMHMHFSYIIIIYLCTIKHFHAQQISNLFHKLMEAYNSVQLDKDLHPHLADFGLAMFQKDIMCVSVENWKSSGKPTGGFHKRNMVGTLIYMAPEILRKHIHTEKSDVYSFAISIKWGLSSL